MRSSPAARLVCLAALAGLAAPGPSHGAEQYALLVAVADYPNLNHLKYTRDDLIDFQNALLGSGFQKDHVVLMHDLLTDAKLKPTIKNIRAQLDLLLDKAHADDTVIVALSGHGVDFVKEKRSYFCPLDADLTDEKTLLGVDDLYDKLKNCRAVRKLLLVDACRNDPGLSGSKGLMPKMELQSLTRPEESDVPEGIVALFSCSAGEKSWESPDLKHGVFFYNFLQAWRGEAPHVGKLTMNSVIESTVNETQIYAHEKLHSPQRPQQKNEFSGVWVLNDAVGPVTPVSPETTTDGAPVTLSSRGAAVLCLAYSADGKHVAGGCADHTVRVWDAATGKEEHALECGGAVSVALDLHGRYVAAGLGDKSVRVWDGKTGFLLWHKEELPECARGLAFSPDGQSLAVAAGSLLEVMTAATGAPSWHFEDSGVYQAVAYSPNGDRLAAGSLLGQVAVWKADGEPDKRAKVHPDGGINVMVYSADGCWLACGSRDKTVKVYDAATMQLQATLKGHDRGVIGLAFPADGKCVDTVSDDKSMRAWDLSGGTEQATLPSHGGAGLPACFAPDGQHIAVAAPDHTLKVLAVDLNR